MNWLDELERRDPAYARAYLEAQTDVVLAVLSQPGVGVSWACLNGCGVLCHDADGGVRCPLCGDHFTDAQLQEADTDD